MRRKAFFLAAVAALAAVVGAAAGWLSVSKPPQEFSASTETCPSTAAATVTVHTTLSIRLNRSDLSASSNVQANAVDVQPPGVDENRATLKDVDLGPLADCLAHTGLPGAPWSPYRVDEFDWTEGTARLRASQAASPLPFGKQEDRWDQAALLVWVDAEKLHVDVDPCRDSAALACRFESNGSFRLTASEQLLPLQSKPHPSRIDRDEENPELLTFTWEYQGRPAPIEAELSPPRAARTSARLRDAPLFTWHPTGQITIRFTTAGLLDDLPELLFALGGLLVIRYLSGRWRSGVAVILGLLLASVAFYGTESSESRSGDAPVFINGIVLVTIAWTAMSLLVGQRKGWWRRALICGVLIVIITLGLVIAFRPPFAWMLPIALATSALGILGVTLAPFALVLPIGLATSALGILGLTLAGAVAAGPRLRSLTELVPPGNWVLRRSWLVAGGSVALGVGLMFAFGYPLGRTLASLTSDERFSAEFLEATARASEGIGYTLVYLAPVIIAGLLAVELKAASRSQQSAQASTAPRRHAAPPRWPMQLALIFLLALAARVPGTWVLSSIRIPAWVVVFAVITMLVKLTAKPDEPVRFAAWPRKAFLIAALRAESKRSAAEEADRKAGDGKAGDGKASDGKAGDGKASDGKASDGKAGDGRASYRAARKAHSVVRTQYPTDVGAAYLRAGPTRGWWRNGQQAALIGLSLAILPLGYYAWTALQELPSDLTWANGLLYFLLGLFLEVFRWLGISFVFGALYQVIPGRVGPLKGMVLAITWLVAALLVQLIARWFGGGHDQLWLYVFLQLVVYLFVLGLLYDWLSVRRGGGSWRRLLDLYRVRGNRDLVAYAAPLAAAGIGLIQQITEGSGFDLAAAFFNSLSKV